ncbi:MAG: DUF4339 domain-containing protein [Anaeromyxobacter sp.]|nr:DUF4339 domain-containing protein [Anaeromyxobacter sp.]MBL0275712.1 DUF4339 domain-containing protein [Anaeromyxobacter sp.]
MSEPLWYYEEAGKQAGPVSQAGLAEAIRLGRLAAGMRVWRAGLAGWLPWEQVPELAALAAPPPLAGPPPLASAPPAPPAAPAWGQPTAAPPSPWASPGAAPGQGPGARPFEEVSVAAVLLLSFVTIGIYGMVKFYQTGVGYERAAQRTSKFTGNFWIYVGLLLGALFLNLVTGFVGYLLIPVVIVYQYLTLNEALTLRAAAMERLGVAVQVNSDSNHRTFLLLGAILSYVVVGVVFTILQTVRWFEDWNAIGRAAGGRLQ